MAHSLARCTDYFRLLRVHHWAKNSLLFVPMIAAHAWLPANFEVLLLAFASFSLTASAAYIVNDLRDLPSDRLHPTKHRRPLASGEISRSHGFHMVPFLLVGGLAFAALVSPRFLFFVCLYFGIALCYTFYLKRRSFVDVVTLAGLYTIRVLAGAAALAIPVSAWLLGFSICLFLSLALVKRHAELREMLELGKCAIAGRQYRSGDLPLLQILSCVAGYAAVIVLALYIGSPTVVGLYSRPAMLWLVCALFLFWISRIFVVTHRGNMHGDPLVFSLTDRPSLITGAVSGLVIFLSI